MKYGILKEDIYNFDKIGFLIGQIETIMIVTSLNKVKSSKLAQFGNQEWVFII